MENEDEELPRRMPLRVRPEPDESIHGFALRVAHRAHMSVADLEQRARFNIETVLHSDAAIRRLAALSGTASEVLDKLRYKRAAQKGKPRAVFMGHVIDSRQIALSPRKFCPECLSESPHHRMMWDLRMYVACHKHGGILLNTCSCSKREPIGWRHLPLEECAVCRQSLARLKPTTAFPDDLASSVLVHQLLSGEVTSLRPEWAGWQVGPQLNKFWELRSARGLRNMRKRDKLLYRSGA